MARSPLLDGLSGYGAPRTRRGLSTSYGPPPWHMTGRTIAIWYKAADPGEVRRHIPQHLRVDDDPIVRARFWDMRHDAGLGDAWPAHYPEQPTFREAVVAFPVHVNGELADYPTYMYSDDPTYVAFGRETMGWPVRMGAIDVSPPLPSPQLKPGVVLTGELRKSSVSVMRASLTLTSKAQEKPPSRLPRWISTRVVPRVDSSEPELVQLVESGPDNVRWGQIWDADAVLEFDESPGDELHFLKPREIVAAQYWSSVELVVGFGRVLEVDD